MKKKMLSVIIVAAMCFSAVQPFTCAETASASSLVEPYYADEMRATTELCVQGSTATCNSYAQTVDTIKITAEQTLQKQGFLWIWSTYNNSEWSKTVNANIISMSNSKSGLSSGKYRLKTVFTLTDKNGKTETITIYSDEKTVG